MVSSSRRFVFASRVAQGFLAFKRDPNTGGLIEPGLCSAASGCVGHSELALKIKKNLASEEARKKRVIEIFAIPMTRFPITNIVGF